MQTIGSWSRLVEATLGDSRLVADTGANPGIQAIGSWASLGYSSLVPDTQANPEIQAIGSWSRLV